MSSLHCSTACLWLNGEVRSFRFPQPAGFRRPGVLFLIVSYLWEARRFCWILGCTTLSWGGPCISWVSRGVVLKLILPSNYGPTVFLRGLLPWPVYSLILRVKLLLLVVAICSSNLFWMNATSFAHSWFTRGRLTGLSFLDWALVVRAFPVFVWVYIN